MLVFIIAIYKRPHLTKQVLAHYKRLSKKYGFKIIVAGSEGEESRKVAQGCHYIEAPNFPISEKNNAMMLEAKKFNPDAVVLLGSDDFICENIIKHYYKLIEEKEDKVFGFKDLYFLDLQNDFLSHFDVGDKSYGAGRFFPRNTLEAMGWKGWHVQADKGLDGINMKRALICGCEYYSIHLSDIDGFLLDVKSGFNISSKNIILAGTQVDLKIMEKKNIKVTKPRSTKKTSVKKVESTPLPDIGKDEMLIVHGTGASPHIPKDRKLNVSKLQAELLIKKGAVVYKK